ncbi:hypothetical protein CEXT_730071 [Caerostris extrusa]|uniref:Uncharacterized protein n=1 Tax=Caerostris extrusa TaxID=172846 RepID=A0AAV4N6B1_CAEEX|nr:hypothetical protein CEXT_730071 [Caerostris extrusa]
MADYTNAELVGIRLVCEVAMGESRSACTRITYCDGCDGSDISTPKKLFGTRGGLRRDDEEEERSARHYQSSTGPTTVQ